MDDKPIPKQLTGKTRIRFFSAPTGLNAPSPRLPTRYIPDTMQRFTISLDDTLAGQFDALIASAGYVNRSEAVRDLIRHRIDSDHLDGASHWCVATITYVYDHHDRTVSSRVQSLQHDHHDLVITSLHTHLDHDHCLETVVLRGRTERVSALAQQLIALRGVRHGSVHLVPLGEDKPHTHDDPPAAAHGHAPVAAHSHLKPLS